MITKRLCIYMTLIAAFLLPPSIAIAQPKALGVSFSFTGISLSYEIYPNQSNSFVDLEIKAENCEFYAGRSKHPGISASASWNYFIKEWKSSETESVQLFAGPGITLGYSSDYKSVDGFLFGLKGRVGAQFSFDRRVIISASLAPIIGSHIIIDNDSVKMNYYRNGLQYALIPEIGIKYRF